MKKINVERILNILYLVIVALFYGMIFSASVLGFLKLYRPWLAILLSIFVALLIIVILIKNNTFIRNNWQKGIKGERSPPRMLEGALYLCSFLMLGLLIMLPLARWPLSPAGDWFPWDAGAYHFPKAIELYRSGSIWDLSISYGEYPFGYEALLSTGLVITGNESLFGFIHVLIVMFFVLAFWQLARRIIKISSAWLLFLITLVILSDTYFQTFNLWRVFYQDIYAVGKNDIFVAAAVLAVLGHFFTVTDDSKGEKVLLGLGVTSMLAVSIKPNALYVLAPLWLFIIMNNRKKIQTVILPLLLVSPGGLWIIRNWIAQGVPFSPQAFDLSKWSIAANLTNPYFYEYIPKNFVILFMLLITITIVAIVRRKDYRLIAFVFWALFLAFIFTPVTAFFIDTQTPASISWRFGEALLAFAFIVLLKLFRDLLQKRVEQIHLSKSLIHLSLIILVLFSFWNIWFSRDRLEVHAENAIILKDQFSQPVGVDGYYSAYDYVQQNVRSAVVWVENGLPYYVYGPGFTNTITRQKSPDYLVAFRTDWHGEGVNKYPALVGKIIKDNTYKLIYEDQQGKVYKRIEAGNY